jgi:hypothetical protein
MRMVPPHVAAVAGAWAAMPRANRPAVRAASKAAPRDPGARRSTVAGMERGPLVVARARRAPPGPAARREKAVPEARRVQGVAAVPRAPAATVVRLGAAAVPELPARAAAPVHPEPTVATVRQALVRAAGPLAKAEWRAWLVRRAPTLATFRWIPSAAREARAAQFPPAARAARADPPVARVAQVVLAGRAGAVERRVPSGSMPARRARSEPPVLLAAAKTTLTGSNGIKRPWSHVPAPTARYRAR